MKRETIVSVLVEFANSYDDANKKVEAKAFDKMAIRVAQMNPEDYYFSDQLPENPDDYKADDLDISADQHNEDELAKAQLMWQNIPEHIRKIITDRENGIMPEDDGTDNNMSLMDMTESKPHQDPFRFKEELSEAGANVNPFED